MTQNEVNLVHIITNLDKRVAEARQYIKDNFNVNSNYNDEDRTLELYVNNVNESLGLVAAKEYIENNFEPGVLTLNI